MIDPYDFPGPPELGAPGLVGARVSGPPMGTRVVVRWYGLLRAAQELDDRFDPDQEAYLSAFAFPRCEYVGHVRRIGSPRGYDGPAACPWLWFDIDRPNLDEARRDTLTLARFLLRRYPKLDCDTGLGVWFSGSKGFHIGVECWPGNRPDPLVPATAKRLALALANAAGVPIDSAIGSPTSGRAHPRGCRASSRMRSTGSSSSPSINGTLYNPLCACRELGSRKMRWRS